MKALVIVQRSGYVSVENGEGKRTQGLTVEKALAAFANKYGIEWSEGDVTSGFEAASAIETMMGDSRPTEQIHTGVVSA